MYDLTKLFEKYSAEVQYLTDIGIKSDYDLLLALEAYKFCTNAEILECVEGEATASLDSLELVYKELGDRLKIALSRENEDSVLAYVPVTREVAISEIELNVDLANVRIVYITPLNYQMLIDKNYRYQYNADILFKRILLEAIRLKATDLHFDVKHVDMEPVYTISYRRDTDLLPMRLFSLTKELNAEIISKLIETKTGVSSLDLLEPSGVVGNASNILGDNDVELRISANKVKDGYHYVIRIQKKQTFSFNLNKLGFNQQVLKDLEEITKRRTGITLITGAIRTGKNTTAFALANEIVKKPVKIVSYESPIEVLMPFTQVDYLGDEVILLNAVRLAKKQDVNIAFLNEIPNKEVAFAIRDLANSSIHVITTMHMNRIWHLPYRLKEYYGDEYKDVISQINGVFNQKMFGVNCPYCSKGQMVLDLPEKYKNYLHNLQSVKTSEGCDRCNQTGLIAGKNQPYAEHLLFTEELVDKLLACDHPYEMEIILRDAVRAKQQDLEHYMEMGFSSGTLPLYAIDHL